MCEKRNSTQNKQTTTTEQQLEQGQKMKASLQLEMLNANFINNLNAFALPVAVVAAVSVAVVNAKQQNKRGRVGGE